MTNMELILGISVGALTVLALLLAILVVTLTRTLKASIEEERKTAKSFIKYTHPGAAFVSEEHREGSYSKHMSLSQKQAEAMNDKAGEAV